jgi:ribose 5-phosphate isomerase A
MLVIVDASKRVERLGKFPLPVEVVPFGVKATAFKIETACKVLGIKPAIVIRVRDGKPFVTDNGNLILDCACGRIDEPARLALLLSVIPGVVEHGLFIGMASVALLGSDAGVTALTRKTS